MPSGSGDSERPFSAGEFCNELQKSIQVLEAVIAAFRLVDPDSVMRPPTPGPQVGAGCAVAIWTTPDNVTVGQIEQVLEDQQIFLASGREALAQLDSGKTLVSQLGTAGS